MQSAQDSLQEAQRLHQYFQALGAQDAQVQVLQPAEILLDLYGEDIRSRAYVTPIPCAAIWCCDLISPCQWYSNIWRML